MAQVNKTIEELNLDDDFLFAKVMSDKEICRKVLEKILNIKIQKIETPVEQKVIDLLLDSKGIRLDIYVQDENNTVYNVEMQKGVKTNLPKRSRYYQGNIDLDMITKGSDYEKLRKSFVIFICTFDPFGRGRHLYTFENLCKEDMSLALGDETTKLFLNTKGQMDDVDEEMLEFLTYIEQSTDEVALGSKSQLVKVLNEKVKCIKRDKSMEVEYMTILERDKEKFNEGKLEGILEGKLEFARALLDLLDDETIAERAGISIEVVRALREKTV